MSLVSIAISTFESGGKGVELLKHNLEQIATQDYPNIQVVISDHSMNNVIKNHVEKFMIKVNFPIIYIKNTEHRGNSSQNTNNAINHCTGDIIKILFMDDYLFGFNSISDIVNSFENNPEKKWLVHGYYHTRDRKNYFRPHYPSWNNKMRDGVNTIGCPSALSIRKEVNERFDDNLKWFMDVEYYYRLHKKYGSPIFLKRLIAVNYLHAGQVSNTQINKQLIANEKNYINKKYHPH